MERDHARKQKRSNQVSITLVTQWLLAAEEYSLEAVANFSVFLRSHDDEPVSFDIKKIRYDCVVKPEHTLPELADIVRLRSINSVQAAEASPWIYDFAHSRTGVHENIAEGQVS